VNTLLWPFAWKGFEYRCNHFKLDKDGLSPRMHWFTGTHVKQDLRTCHPFGCPVFVLQAGLQNVGGTIPKWEPRTRVGVYLGHSPYHAGLVALVMNPRTLHVSPQYHLVFDDEFATVPFMNNGEVPALWSDLVQKSSASCTDEDFDLATSWANDFINASVMSVTEEDGSDSSDLLLNQPTPGVCFTIPEEAIDNDDETHEVSESIPSPSGSTPEDAPVAPGIDPLLFPTMPDLNDLTCRRSPRIRRKPKMFGFFTACAVLATSMFTGAVTEPIRAGPSSMLQKLVLHTEKVNTHFDGKINQLHHAALSTVAGDNDTYTLTTMLQQEDKNAFITAMTKEVLDHESRDHWMVMLTRRDKPVHDKTIMAICSFKFKRNPDGTISTKYKAHLCAHGGIQTTWGVNYWETYAPVVNWLSVSRTTLALSLVHNLETKLIDFVLSFPQADLAVDIYMELPYGFDMEGQRGNILKLNKNLY
jgi:hypothetical protein